MKNSKKILSIMLSIAMTATMLAQPLQSEAASKKYVKKLSVASSVELNANSSKKVNVKVTANAKLSAKQLAVSAKSSNNSIVTVKIASKPKKTGKSGTSTLALSAKKAGAAKITVTAKTKGKNKKSIKKEISVTVNSNDLTNTVTNSNDSVNPAIKPDDTTQNSNIPAPTPGSQASEAPKPTPDNQTPGTPTQAPDIPASEYDFQIRSDVAGTSAICKFTQDIRLINLSVNTGTLPTTDTISKYVWYKDGKEITKDSLKLDTTVDKSTIAIVETGEYSLKITTEHSVFNPNTMTNDVTYTDYSSNTITIGSEIEKPETDVVKWTIETSTIEKQWSYKDEETGENFLFPITLKRELVSFNPWPASLEQVEYVIKNCNDPFVIGALYVVAMDNYNYAEGQSNIEKRGITSMLMTNALATGAFIPGLDIATLGIQPSEKSTIQTGGYNDLGFLAPVGSALVGTATTDKENGYVYKYAPRTFCDGATHENGYAPNGNPADINDKTKWKIVVDQYPYCFDQVVGDTYADVDPVVKKEGTVKYQVTDKYGNKSEREDDWSNMPALHKDPKFITVCPVHYVLDKESEDSDLIADTKNSLVRVGLVWSKNYSRWVATDYASMNGFTHEKQGLPTHYNYQGQGIFSNAYVAPAVNSGF